VSGENSKASSTGQMPLSDAAGSPCCGVWPEIADTFGWMQDGTGNRRMPYLPANGVLWRINHCPSCGRYVRDVVIRPAMQGTTDTKGDTPLPHGDGTVLRARIDDAVRKVWLAYRDASDAHADMMTEQDLELWAVVTRHRAVQDRLNATLLTPPPELPADKKP
jgi:hypothetical protein